MRTPKLSDASDNMIENLAGRIAKRQGGKISPCHLIPYLPVSLEIIKSCLDRMVDRIAVLSDRIDNLCVYTFSNCNDTEKQPGALHVDTCLSCDADISQTHNDVFCTSCSEAFTSELNKLAERTGWPAQAVYEHEILYITSNFGNPIHLENLAGRSRYTLRQMRKKTQNLSLEGYAREALDTEAGVITYHFPSLDYPRDFYKKNMELIESYPSSVMEEVQTKVVQILFSLGILILGLFVLGFLHVPFPFLALLFFVAGPAISFFVWRRRKKVEED
jgi:hypothetical protein